MDRACAVIAVNVTCIALGMFTLYGMLMTMAILGNPLWLRITKFHDCTLWL